MTLPSNKKFDFADAISSLYPTCQWSITDDNLENIWWHNENEFPLPTREELEIEVQRLQAEYEYNQYQRDRASAYPSIQDQLDILYHKGYDGWKDEISKVKENYPKPKGL